MDNNIPKIKQKPKNSEFYGFKKDFDDRMFHQKLSITFDSLWRKGKSVLQSKVVDASLRDHTCGMMLKLFDSSPENYDRYKHELPEILKNVSPSVQVWYFFDNSGYYYNYLSNKKSYLSVFLFKVIWSTGIQILKNSSVNISSKSDIAERMLLITEASDPDILEQVTSEITISDQIEDIHKYVIRDVFIQRMKDYDFSFKFFERPTNRYVSKILLLDDVESVCSTYKVIESPEEEKFSHSKIAIYVTIKK